MFPLNPEKDLPRRYITAELADLCEHLDVIGPWSVTIPVVVERYCDHIESLCDSPECIESWSQDWILYLDTGWHSPFAYSAPVRIPPGL